MPRLTPDIVLFHLLPLLSPEEILKFYDSGDFPVTEEIFNRVFGDNTSLKDYDREMLWERQHAKLYTFWDHNKERLKDVVSDKFEEVFAPDGAGPFFRTVAPIRVSGPRNTIKKVLLDRDLNVLDSEGVMYSGGKLSEWHDKYVLREHGSVQYGERRRHPSEERQRQESQERRRYETNDADDEHFVEEGEEETEEEEEEEAEEDYRGRRRRRHREREVEMERQRERNRERSTSRERQREYRDRNYDRDIGGDVLKDIATVVVIVAAVVAVFFTVRSIVRHYTEPRISEHYTKLIREGRNPRLVDFFCQGRDFIVLDDGGYLWRGSFDESGYGTMVLIPLLLVDSQRTPVSEKVLGGSGNIVRVEGRGPGLWRVSKTVLDGSSRPKLHYATVKWLSGRSWKKQYQCIPGCSLYLDFRGRVFSLDAATSLDMVTRKGPFVRMFAGFEHSVVLVDRNGKGIIVTSEDEIFHIDESTLGGLEVASIAFGRAHALILTKQREVYSFGEEEDYVGCLGLGRLEQAFDVPGVSQRQVGGHWRLCLDKPTKIDVPGNAYGVYAEGDLSVVLVSE